ncbi:hypothetical protein RRF57_005581 [Xylaria bambusicola]|uniref:Uncharacterized protein n=1 Tax=Xylaria bambusicola TaxID=326684 RepID=A0AAN7UNU4_9PEZI
MDVPRSVLLIKAEKSWAPAIAKPPSTGPTRPRVLTSPREDIAATAPASIASTPTKAAVWLTPRVPWMVRFSGFGGGARTFGLSAERRNPDQMMPPSTEPPKT